MTVTRSGWTGVVSVDDTALAVSSVDGPGRPVVYLNGEFAAQPARIAGSLTRFANSPRSTITAAASATARAPSGRFEARTNP